MDGCKMKLNHHHLLLRINAAHIKEHTYKVQQYKNILKTWNSTRRKLYSSPFSNSFILFFLCTESWITGRGKSCKVLPWRVGLCQRKGNRVSTCRTDMAL